MEASAHLPSPLLRCQVPGLQQCDGTVLGDTQLMSLHGLPGLERQQLVGCLRRLQGTLCGLAAPQQIGERLFIGDKVLHGLRLDAGGGAQRVECLTPSHLRIPGHLPA